MFLTDIGLLTDSNPWPWDGFPAVGCDLWEQLEGRSEVEKLFTL